MNVQQFILIAAQPTIRVFPLVTLLARGRLLTGVQARPASSGRLDWTNGLLTESYFLKRAHSIQQIYTNLRVNPIAPPISLLPILSHLLISSPDFSYRPPALLRGKLTYHPVCCWQTGGSACTWKKAHITTGLTCIPHTQQGRSGSNSGHYS